MNVETVVNFTPNFVGKLQSSSQVKFASFGVVGLVIKLQMNLNSDLRGTEGLHITDRWRD